MTPFTASIPTERFQSFIAGWDGRRGWLLMWLGIFMLRRRPAAKAVLSESPRISKPAWSLPDTAWSVWLLPAPAERSWLQLTLFSTLPGAYRAFLSFKLLT